MSDDADQPVVRGAETLIDVLAGFERDGYSSQFRAVAGGKLECLNCHRESAANAVPLERLHRLEGASDPADMLAVAGLQCPHCERRGTAVLNYGPDSTVEDADVLLALDDVRR